MELRPHRLSKSLTPSPSSSSNSSPYKTPSVRSSPVKYCSAKSTPSQLISIKSSPSRSLKSSPSISVRSSPGRSASVKSSPTRPAIVINSPGRPRSSSVKSSPSSSLKNSPSKSAPNGLRRNFHLSGEELANTLRAVKRRREKRKRSNSRGSPSPKPANKKHRFNSRQDVLARWSDGLFYLGNILKADDKNSRCLVHFEDDSKYWILFKDLLKGAKEGDASCCVCQGEHSEQPNEIVLCDNCELGYHQQCHNPPVSSDIVNTDEEWNCRLCVFALTVKRGGALKNGPSAQALQEMKQSLPYDLHLLTWDAQHKSNVEQCYCYCGGPGDWFLKMLQCCRCKQWFHEACIQCLSYPLLNGDRFYLFVCSHCNMGPEYIKRLEMKWVDLTHLVLFNLAVQDGKKYHDTDDIMDFLQNNWEILQLPAELNESPYFEREKKINSVLHNAKHRFASGREIRKKMDLWGLRVRAPPTGLTLILPIDGPINDEVMNSLQMIEKRKTKSFVPMQCILDDEELKKTLSNSPVQIRYKKGGNKDIDQSIALLSKNARKKLLGATKKTKQDTKSTKSVNQDYKGYNGKLPLKVEKIEKPAKKSEKRSNINRLDSLIPPPVNFEGHNHPFLTEIEQKEKLARHIRKTEILNYYCNSSDSDTASQSSVSSIFSFDDPTKFIPTPPPSLPPTQSTPEYPDDKKSKGRKRKNVEMPEESTRQSKRRRVNRSSDVIDPMTIESIKSHDVNMERIKNNINHYFGAAGRLKKGEKFTVHAKRVTPSGKVQYLVEWENVIIK